jgi:dCMP deaminase
MRQTISWREFWMELALLAAKRSKDPDTQVGAVLVCPSNDLHFIGYNGFPKKLPETPERWKRPEKYRRVLHAEQNAILNRNCSVKDWICYVTLKPCSGCMLELAQAGIAKVIYLRNREDLEYELTEEIASELGIILERYEEGV